MEKKKESASASLKKNLVERIYLTNTEFTSMEKSVLLHEHLRRYGSIRRFCYGKTLDFAAGCGYGTYLVAGNPDVSAVVGADMNDHAISWAKTEFSHKKIEYRVATAAKIKEKFDTLVCLETIEHIKDTTVIRDLVERCSIDNLIISFPDKITTHYNPHHFHDFVLQDIIDMFPNHIPYHTLRFVDSVSVMLIRTPAKAPKRIFRNILDL